MKLFPYFKFKNPVSRGIFEKTSSWLWTPDLRMLGFHYVKEDTMFEQLKREIEIAVFDLFAALGLVKRQPVRARREAVAKTRPIDRQLRR